VREMANENERVAIERDRAFRAALPRGRAWFDVPPGGLPVVAMTEAAKAEQPRRRSMLEDAFAGEGSTLYVLPPQPVDEGAS
jgi:hypothetical protein